MLQNLLVHALWIYKLLVMYAVFNMIYNIIVLIWLVIAVIQIAIYIYIYPNSPVITSKLNVSNYFCVYIYSLI